MPDLKYNIIQTLAVLPAVGKWHKELNLKQLLYREFPFMVRLATWLPFTARKKV